MNDIRHLKCNQIKSKANPSQAIVNIHRVNTEACLYPAIFLPLTTNVSEIPLVNARVERFRRHGHEELIRA